jgi:Lrp/AsnC family leucine-responsive transcriptional regulator
VALLDARRLGRDVAAFIGVATERARDIAHIEGGVVAMDDVLECHHVTGSYTLMLKVKTESTQSLEQLIESIRSLDGVARTETMVVLSTHLERPRVALMDRGEFTARPPRRSGGSRGRRAIR